MGNVLNVATLPFLLKIYTGLITLAPLRGCGGGSLSRQAFANGNRSSTRSTIERINVPVEKDGRARPAGHPIIANSAPPGGGRLIDEANDPTQPNRYACLDLFNNEGRTRRRAIVNLGPAGTENESRGCETAGSLYQ